MLGTFFFSFQPCVFFRSTSSFPFYDCSVNVLVCYIVSMLVLGTFFFSFQPCVSFRSTSSFPFYDCSVNGLVC